MIETLSFILWFSTGVLSFVYWWTRKHDLTVSDLPFLILYGVGGSITAVVCWSLYGKKTLFSRLDPYSPADQAANF